MEAGRKQVFIASVYGEGYDTIRKIVKIAIKEIDSPITPLIDIDLTEGYASDDFPLDHCLNNVAKSEYMILIMGSKYGSIPKGKSKSYTHLEYEHAIKLGIPVMVFCIHKMIKGKLSVEMEQNLPEWYTQLAEHSIDDSVDPFIKDENYIKEQVRKAIFNQFIEDKYKFPNEVYELNSIISNASSAKYKEYLKSENLEYVSRKAYKIEAVLSDTFLTEDDIFNKIFNDDNNGLFIRGAGGVGKTRLMKELGMMAQKEEWVVLEISKNFKGWDTLILNPQKKYCFLFDYVEENKYFTPDILEILSGRYIYIEIKIIANTRFTYKNLPDRFDICDLSKTDDEKNYTQYVTKKILEQADQNSTLKLDNFKQFIDKPAFATFLLQGLKDNKLDLNEIKEFPDYIKKRLAKAIGKDYFVDIEPVVFYILAGLSFDNKNRDHKKIVSALQWDGWIESNGIIVEKELHDTIFDELFIQYFNKPDFINDWEYIEEISNFFDFAVESDGFINTLTAFGRIGTNERIKKVNWSESIFSNYTHQIKNNISLFMDSSLLGNNDKLLYIKKYDICSFNDIELVKWLFGLSKNENYEDELIDDNKKAFNTWKSFNENVFLDEILATYAIPMYYNLIGNDDFIHAKTMEWLENFSHLEEAKYIYSSYLGDFALLENYIVEWLKKYGHLKHISYVFGTYLKKGGNISKIQTYFSNWLNISKNCNIANLLFRTYLNEKGLSDEIKPYIIQWLELYGNNIPANYLLQEFIKQGLLEEIKPYALKWLETNSQSIPANYLLQEFIKQGLLEEIKPYINTWLSIHGEMIEANFIIRSYLDYGGSADKIEKYVCKWLDCFDNIEESHLLIQSYIRNGGNAKLIETNIMNWIYSNYNSQNAFYVLDLYVKTNEGIYVIEQIVHNCQEDFQKGIIYNYLLLQLLKTEEFRIPALQMVIDKLTKYGPSIDNKKIIESYLAADGRFSDVVKQHMIIMINTWSSSVKKSEISELIITFIENEKSIYLIDTELITWFEEYSEKRFNQNYYKVLNAYLQYGGLLISIERLVTTWIKTFYTKYHAASVIKIYLDNGGPFFNVVNEIINYIDKYPCGKNSTALLIIYIINNGDFDKIKEKVLNCLEDKENSGVFKKILEDALKDNSQSDKLQKFYDEILG